MGIGKDRWFVGGGGAIAACIAEAICLHCAIVTRVASRTGSSG